MQQLGKMGPLQQVMSMLPGASKAIKDEDAEKGEAQLKLMESIILSMTPAERKILRLLTLPQKRIAAGSGTDVPAVNRLLKQFDQMQKMMKQFGGGGKRANAEECP